MIYYDRKYVMKRIWLTWRKRKLEVVGVYEFLIKDKEIIKLYKQPSKKYILDLVTMDEKYGGMLEVGPKEYRKANIGTTFGKRTLLRDKKKRDYYVIAKSSIPEYALKEVSRESKIYLFILLLIILCTIVSGVYLFVNFFQ